MLFWPSLWKRTAIRHLSLISRGAARRTTLIMRCLSRRCQRHQPKQFELKNEHDVWDSYCRNADEWMCSEHRLVPQLVPSSPLSAPHPFHSQILFCRVWRMWLLTTSLMLHCDDDSHMSLIKSSQSPRGSISDTGPLGDDSLTNFRISFQIKCTRSSLGVKNVSDVLSNCFASQSPSGPTMFLSGDIRFLPFKKKKRTFILPNLKGYFCVAGFPAEVWDCGYVD